MLLTLQAQMRLAARSPSASYQKHYKINFPNITGAVTATQSALNSATSFDMPSGSTVVLLVHQHQLDF